MTRKLKDEGEIKMTKLWKLNKTTGYFFLIKSVTDDNAKAWLKIFQDDEPKEHFKISKNKPSIKTNPITK